MYILTIKLRGKFTHFQKIILLETVNELGNPKLLSNDIALL